MYDLFHDLYLKRCRQTYIVLHATQIRAQDKISDYYFYVGLNFVSAAIVFASSSVLRYSNEIKSPGPSGSRSRYSRVANRRYAKIESSSIVQKSSSIEFYIRPRILSFSVNITSNVVKNKNNILNNTQIKFVINLKFI